MIRLAVKVKIKFTLERAVKVQNGESRYNCTLFLTSALDGGGSSTRHPDRFTPGNDTVRIVQEAGWALGLVCEGAENLAPNRDSIPTLSSL